MSNKYLNITNYTEFFNNLFPIAFSFNDGKYDTDCEIPEITEDMVTMIDKNEETGATILSIDINKWLSLEKTEKAFDDDDISDYWDNLDYLICFLQDCKSRRDNKK